MTYKTIFKGHLEFATEKSYDKVLKMYQHRVENYYKSDILLNEEEIFDDETRSLRVPRHIAQGSEKSYKNTVSLLEYVAQFAVAGNFGTWMTESGKVLNHGWVEPKSDKAAVLAFRKGRALKDEGKEDEAMQALNRAIEKYDRHSQAYGTRGHVNLLLGQLDAAEKDFTKSINLTTLDPEPFYGRAKVRIAKKEYETAIGDLEMAIKNSIPLQPIYYKARRGKGLCHMDLKQWEKAIFEFQLFLKRKFTEDNSNFYHQKRVAFHLAKAYMMTGRHEEAQKTFKSIKTLPGHAVPEESLKALKQQLK